MADDRAKVGVGLLIFKDGKLLLAERKSDTHAGGEYAGPGGHVEYGETLEECAIRETREECGIEITNVRVVAFGTIFSWHPYHYLAIGIAADWKSGDPQNLEPHKRTDWEWYSLDALPSPLIAGDKECLDAMKTGTMYFGTLR